MLQKFEIQRQVGFDQSSPNSDGFKVCYTDEANLFFDHKRSRGRRAEL